MMVNEGHHWEAPGRLELVRAFLNTGPPAGGETGDQLVQLVELRDGLGELLGPPAVAPAAAWLNGWFERTRLRPVAAAENGELAVRLACPPRSGLAGALVEAVAAALADGTWARMRRCPDCQLVFWDRTRNASKVWCGMYAGPDGRACGSIAKVRRYRARQAGRLQPAEPGR
jgi:hypothetical protein